MSLETEKSIRETIRQIDLKIADPKIAQTSGAVMHLSQAALNLAQTAKVLKDMKSSN